jgi:hypothetical protein
MTSTDGLNPYAGADVLSHVGNDRRVLHTSESQGTKILRITS